MPEPLTHRDFLARVGETFTVLGPDGTRRPLELVDVAVHARAAGGVREPFTLDFREPLGDSYLQQQIVRLEHEGLGPLELFIVPRGPADGHMRYDADFT